MLLHYSTYRAILTREESGMQQIDIDFEVFKALTMMRRNEAHTYNEVIRDLLGIQQSPGRRLTEGFSSLTDGLSSSNEPGGFLSRGLFLPNGTMLRATHKGKEYRASISNDGWFDEDGTPRNSPSEAASHITGNNVNGRRFWQAKRPSDTDWRNLDTLPAAS